MKTRNNDCSKYKITTCDMDYLAFLLLPHLLNTLSPSLNLNKSVLNHDNELTE